MEEYGYRLDTIAGVLGARSLGVPDDRRIRHLSIDSRRSFFPEGTLFFALKGQRHDGHDHLADLSDKGVRSFVISDPRAQLRREGHAHLLVSDTLDALQRLAGWHRAHFRYPVIGITGSNGKTVVKEWLYQMLQGRGHIVRSPGSWNSQVGVPLSVWEMNAGHDLAIFEAGISEPGEMDRLRAMIRPTIGVFTNIGPAHGENFRNDQEKALEKVRLFQGCEAVVVCADHAPVMEALRRTGMDQRMKVRGWSRERNGWLHVVREERTGQSTRISVLNDHVEMTFGIPFIDQASIENALHCVTLLLHLGHDPQWIASRTPSLTSVAMRLEVLEGIHGMKLINDAYSNDPASLGIALEHLGVVGAGTKKVVVLTEMVGTGAPTATPGPRIGDMLARAGTDLLIHVGSFGDGPALGGHKGEVWSFPDAATMLREVDPASLAGATVLVKGARSFALEQVVRRWERKVHGTVLEVDLEAVRHNLNHYRSLLGPTTRIMAMVKAFGYGSGALELARLFEHERVHYLGVAFADEGVELRRNGVKLPILVMNPEPVPFRVLHEHGLEAEVYDAASLEEAIAFNRSVQVPVPLHLKLDTGMHRLGFTSDDLPGLLERSRGTDGSYITSIFSHLVASGSPEHDEYTRWQIEEFDRMYEAIVAVIGRRPPRHIANSAAIGRFPRSHMEMVRLGIGLHGVGSGEAETRQLRHTLTLRTIIAQVKTIRKGDTVGYERAFKAGRDMRIATLPIGYADGFSRRLGNGKGLVHVNGRPCPVVGNVCMDMCMVDVTGTDAATGDEVIILNGDHPITELAEAMGTIPYEVLTSISQRVKRVHVHA